MSLIGAEFSFKEAASIDETAGDAPALKHSIQVHALEIKEKGYIDHTRGQQDKLKWSDLLQEKGQLIFKILRKSVSVLRQTVQAVYCSETNEIQ